MTNFVAIKEKDGRYTAGVSCLSRKDAIELANLLSSSGSDYLKKFGLSTEAELMEVSLGGDTSGVILQRLYNFTTTNTL